MKNNTVAVATEAPEIDLFTVEANKRIETYIAGKQYGSDQSAEATRNFVREVLGIKAD